MPRRSIRRKAKRRTKHIKVIGGASAKPHRPAPLPTAEVKAQQAADREAAEIKAQQAAEREAAEIGMFRDKLYKTNFDDNEKFVLSIMADVIYSLALGNTISRKNLKKILEIQQYS